MWKRNQLSISHRKGCSEIWLFKMAAKVKVTQLIDYVKNVIIRFAMVENLYVIDISFLSVTERPVLGFC